MECRSVWKEREFLKVWECSTSLVIGEIKFIFYLTSIDMIKIFKTSDSFWYPDMSKGITHPLLVELQPSTAIMIISVVVLQEHRNWSTSWYSSWVYAQKAFSFCHRDICQKNG